MSPLKSKVRNGILFEVAHEFERGDYVILSWDWYDVALSVRYYVGDTTRNLNIQLLWFNFNLWF